MTMLSDADAADLPVLTEQDAVHRVAELVGKAIRRQLWVFLFDREGQQLPILIPIDGIPVSPDTEEVTTLMSGLSETLAEFAPGGTLVFALERPGEAAPHAFDELWANVLFDAALGTCVDVLAVALCHDHGVTALDGHTALRR